MKPTVLPSTVLAIVTLLAAGCERGPVEPDGLLASHGAGIAAVTGFTNWSVAVNLELTTPGADPSFNTPAVEGCPFTSRDGKTLFIASNRPGGLGGIDIWVSRRASTSDRWGPPENLGAPINSSADDYCPTLDRDGHRFFFVSRRAVDGACGGADIYVTRIGTDGTVEEPRNLGCSVNSAFDEASPFPLPQPGRPPALYFSSTRPGLGAGGDIYVSESRGTAYAPAQLVPGINSTADDGQPNVRHDGLEVFFYSTRADAGALGGPDIYVATRSSVFDSWSTPVNLGPNVNSAAGETRPSLSWDGTMLYFGSTRPGGEGASDIYVTTREAILP